MNFRFPIAAFALAISIHAATPLEDAVALFKEKKYPDARAALEKITTAEPNNAAACYYLGMTLLRRGDGQALEDALPWVEKATKLDPNNALYLADFGGISMSVADKRRSLSSLGLVKRGRDAMEKSLSINPENLDARTGLFRFYSEAPMGLSDAAKAASHLEEIRKRDSKRAALLQIDVGVRTKKFAEAFKLCEELLAKNPGDLVALFQYGRVALASGQNLERAITGLKKYIELAIATPGSANITLGWLRIGNLQEKLGQREEARVSYQAALKQEPNHKAATAALANLK